MLNGDGRPILTKGAVLSAIDEPALRGAHLDVLHVLWLEVTGLFFLVLAVVGGGAAVREYHRYAHGATGVGKVLLAATFALAFLYFGVSSFTRSRRR